MILCENIFKTLFIPNQQSLGADIFKECSLHVTCHMLHVTCHMSCVTSQVLFLIYFFFTKLASYLAESMLSMGLPRLVLYKFIADLQNVIFSESGPLGPFSHRVAMSVCLCVCAIGCSFFLGLSLAMRSHDQFKASHWGKIKLVTI